MKPLKKTLFVFVVMITLITLGMYILTTSLKPTVIQDIINKQLGNITTQPCHIDGEFTWQLFPRPGIKITQIYIGEENNNSNYSLYIENLRFNLQITPLLRGHFIFNDLHIDGLNMLINPDAKPSVLPPVFRNTNITNKPPAQFAIDRFLLTRGKITLVRLSNKMALNGLQVEAKQINLKNDYFPVQLKATLAATVGSNKAKGLINYTGRIRLTPSMLNQPQKAFEQSVIEGQLIAQNIRFNRLKIAKLSANAMSKKGTLILNPLNLSLYGGESVGDLTYQVGSKYLSLNQTATHLDAFSFFNDLFTKNLVKGHLDFSLHATTNLQDNQWQKNTHGNGNLTLKDGTLYLIDLNQLINDAVNKIHTMLAQEQDKKKTIHSLPQSNLKTSPKATTPFQLLSTQYRLLDAQLINDSLLLQTDNLQVTGHGQINLIDSSLNYRLLAKLASSDPLTNKVQQLLGGSFPINISGNLSNPHVIMAAQETNPLIASYLLNQTIGKPVNQVKEQLGDLLNELTK